MKINNQLDIIRKDVTPLVEVANAIAITTQEGMKGAVEVLSKLNQINDRITAEKEKVTKPLNAALKAERGRWKPIEDMYETAIGSIRAKMSAYQSEEVKRQKDEEARIAARVGAGRGKLKIETAVSKIEAIKKVDEKIAGDSGMVQFREVEDFEVMDVTMLPIDCLLPNEVEIRKKMKAGVKVEGVRYFTKQVPVNFR